MEYYFLALHNFIYYLYARRVVFFYRRISIEKRDSP
jgi:hypothetical protein